MWSVFRHVGEGTFKLQFRTTLLLTCVVLAATGLTGVTYLRISSRLTVAEAKRHARDTARILATVSAPAVEARDNQALAGMVQAVVPESELSYAIFTDTLGHLLAGQQRGEGNLTPFLLDEAGKVSVEPINQPMLATHGGTGSRVDIVYPITAPAKQLGASAPPATIGFVRLGISMATTETRLAAVVKNVIGLAVGITLLMVPLGYEVVRNVVGPLNRLADAAKDFARGNLDARVAAKRRDEIGDLSRTFNSMADELARSHNQLVKLNAELEDRVLRRTVELEQANERLSEMAARDSLTGLFNRRHFTNLLAQFFAESARYNTELTCMMLDLDNFKRVNDSLGHQTGDQLLQLAADAIRETIRESDVAVRYGGDEFVILLPQTSSADARNLAERLLTHFRAKLVQKMPEANIATLSIGLANREQDQPASPMDLVTLADEALYLAKAGGKNRITVVRPVAAGEHGA